MDYQGLGEKYKSYFKDEYKKFIDKLIDEVKAENGVIDYSKYTSKTVNKPKEITSNFLKLEKIEDHNFTDNLTFSLDYSFYLEFLSHNDRVGLDSKLFNEITEHNKNYYR